mgnify:CR=1 FL=1
MMTYDKLHSQIVEDLEVLGFDNLVKDMHTLKTLRPMTKKVIKRKAPTKEVFLNLVITEAGKVTELRLEEKKAEAYLKLKQKERVKLIDAYCKREGINPPNVERFRNYLDSEYVEAKELFSKQLTAAGLNFEVQISRC